MKLLTAALSNGKCPNIMRLLGGCMEKGKKLGSNIVKGTSRIAKNLHILCVNSKLSTRFGK